MTRPIPDQPPNILLDPGGWVLFRDEHTAQTLDALAERLSQVSVALRSSSQERADDLSIDRAVVMALTQILRTTAAQMTQVARSWIQEAVNQVVVGINNELANEVAGQEMGRVAEQMADTAEFFRHLNEGMTEGPDGVSPDGVS